VPFIRDNKLYVLSKNYDAYRVEYIDLEKPEFEKKLYLGDVDVSVSATECLLYRFMYDYKYYMEAEELPWNHLILMEGYDTMTQVKDGKWYYLTSDLDSKESSYNRLEFKTDNGSDSASLAKDCINRSFFILYSWRYAVVYPLLFHEWRVSCGNI
jgi:hypothetical protein